MKFIEWYFYKLATRKIFIPVNPENIGALLALKVVVGLFVCGSFKVLLFAGLRPHVSSLCYSLCTNMYVMYERLLLSLAQFDLAVEIIPSPKTEQKPIGYLHLTLVHPTI